MHVLAKFISLMPRSIQKEFSKLRNQTNMSNRAARGDSNNGMDDMSAKELYVLLAEFLKNERREAITYHSAELYRSKCSSCDKEHTGVCKKVNHIQGDASNKSKPKSNPKQQQNSPKETEEAKSKREAKHKEFGKCKVCNQDHTFTTKRGLFASNRFSDCPQWRALPQQRKLEKIVDVKGC